MLRASSSRGALTHYVDANKGEFKLVAAAANPAVVIHAVEPLPEEGATFQAVHGANPNVTLHRIAAGPADDTLTINVSRRRDSSSLLPISGLQSETFPGTEKAGALDVPVRRLDDVLADAALPRPALVKLDVQGFELEALKGMTALLQRVDYVYAEVSFKELYSGQPLAHEIIRWLDEHDFPFACVNTITSSASGEPVQADILFARRG